MSSHRLNANEHDGVDHREVANRLDLFHFQDEAPGMVFWHPRGFTLYRLLESAARQVLTAQAYQEIRTPQILRRPVWDASGHWRHFHEGMFHVQDQAVESAVKPVSCPGHLYVAGRRAPSYRDLPLRLAEFGVVHRDEPSGTLHGLMRLRQFTQDDGHIFCADDERAEDEVVNFCSALPPFYSAFGFSRLSLALSTRPLERAGSDEDWDKAEATLLRALSRLGQPYDLQPGQGAFYGPKLEYALHDRMGRQWQCGTIQLDLVMPKNFDLHYVDAAGRRRHPVMLHRALYGSLERFMGIVLEQHGASLPAWLAPEQARVLPLSAEQKGEGGRLCMQLRARGVRAQLAHEGSLSRRIAQAHEDGVPVALIVGARELAQGTVTVRRGNEQNTVPCGEALERVQTACASPALVQSS